MTNRLRPGPEQDAVRLLFWILVIGALLWALNGSGCHRTPDPVGGYDSYTDVAPFDNE